MKIRNKFTLIFCSLIFLVISACSDKPANQIRSESGKITTEENSLNSSLKPEEHDLSISNKADVQADLIQLNQIVNGMNSQSLALREEIINAHNDSKKIKVILFKSNDIQKQGLDDLMNLALKSSEIQAIRTKLIENLSITQKMFELSNEPNFTMQSPSAEFKSLSLRSQKLQFSIGKELDRLNNEFKLD